MYDRILLATDGSPTADRAASHAVALARQSGADLHAVYVIETRTAYDNAIVDPETVRENFRTEGETALTTVANRASPELAVATAVRDGVPHEELLAYVDDHDIDLVVMGSKGASAFKTVLLGSVTEAVLDAETVPVLVVDGPDGQGE
ncbi:universal stress protein UspA [Halobellus salinus]|uniref:Universal stress protein UspA n=1 Tax=Halobellus salinus TaxID=931585 RepID=A0A830EBZ4_9EURY|nr:universal stress protein [Halobellus salinus]GGI96890.1 universal stress protein UspA [Halobellus salinus]SMP13581.1 Nucleotide-binding universal stress protein, UspA family [Halobellus salinus]